MLYVLFMEDDPLQSHLRQELLSTHLEYLEVHKKKVVLGGAQLREDGITRHGSVIIINAKDLADAREFSKNEPYCKGGLFKTIHISRMRRGTWHPENAPATPDGN